MRATMVRGPARKMYRIKNIPAGLKWTSRPGLRFLFYFLKDMKAVLVEFIIAIVYVNALQPKGSSWCQ